jgi:hypothetical protein
MKSQQFIYILGLFLSLSSLCFSHDLSQVTPNERFHYVRHSQIWHSVPISSLNLFEGPGGSDAFKFEQEVHCQYVREKRSGTSPKFHCKLDTGEVVKVRYGKDNTEVYGQIAASRLLWALGFGANENYPVTVVCDGCSKDPWNDPHVYQQTMTFVPATIERKVKGVEMNEFGKSKQGWGWNELEHVGEGSGHAPRAQIDALKLLAVFMSHVDSRPNNQRFVCLEDGIVEKNGRMQCAKPLMYISDVGTTFGGALEQGDRSTLQLKSWLRWPVWRDAQRCVAYLEPAEHTAGMLRSPKISEAGRKFLSHLLEQLSDQQIRDIFRAAQVDEVEQPEGYASIDQWMEAFKLKRKQISQVRCPELHPSR